MRVQNLNPQAEACATKSRFAIHHEGNSQMAMNPADLIRRPVVAGGRVPIGYDENGKIRF
jgi:arsenate reductase-like glutaredoxin family protein